MDSLAYVVPARHTRVGVASAEGINAAGFWKMLHHGFMTERRSWCRKALKAFVCDRLSPIQIELVIDGKCEVTIEESAIKGHPTVIIRVEEC
jgi:hypothetical protein